MSDECDRKTPETRNFQYIQLLHTDGKAEAIKEKSGKLSQPSSKMEGWLSSSLLSAILYSAWALCGKFAQSKGLTPTDSQVVTILTMSALAVRLALTSDFRSPKDLPVAGAGFAIAAGVLTTTAGGYYSDALSSGDGSVVAAIAGSYPALTFLVSAFMGWEKVNSMKALGVVFAVASTYCFSKS